MDQQMPSKETMQDERNTEYLIQVKEYQIRKI